MRGIQSSVRLVARVDPSLHRGDNIHLCKSTSFMGVATILRYSLWLSLGVFLVDTVLSADAYSLCWCQDTCLPVHDASSPVSLVVVENLYGSRIEPRP